MIMNKIFLILIILSIPLNAMKLYMPLYLQKEDPYYKYRNLVVALENNDYRLCKHLLETIGVSPDAPDIPSRGTLQAPIRYAKSLHTAKLLIAHGATIPENVLELRFTQCDFSVELLQFYLEGGVRPKYNALWQLICWRQSLSTPAERLKPKLVGWVLGAKKQAAIDVQVAKALLLLKHGLSASHQNSAGFTALHYAAGDQNEDMCKLLIESETIHQKEFLSFLMCCKRNFPRFYAQKDMLRLLWNDLSPNRLLAMKNSEGRTAWDYWQVEWLKPMH